MIYNLSAISFLQVQAGVTKAVHKGLEPIQQDFPACGPPGLPLHPMHDSHQRQTSLLCGIFGEEVTYVNLSKIVLTMAKNYKEFWMLIGYK